MLRILPVILFVTAAFMFSCSEDSPTEPEKSFFEIQGPNGFVGQVNDTDAFIALVVANAEGIVYVCNGDEEIAEWIKGDLSDPKSVNLTNGAGANVSAQLKGEAFEGTITLSDDRTFSFTATPNRNQNSGIFRVYGKEAADAGIVAGWVLNADGEQRGSLRIRNSFRQTVRLGTISDGTSNTVVISERAFPVQTFQVPTAAADSVSIVAPNN